MADRELKRLSRRELLEMLIAQGRENERLQAEITQLEEQLHEREIHLAQSGNIAEAALRLNGIFEAAQRAAEQYLENISRGEITKALIGETDDFVLIDANGNTILPGQEWDETDLSDPDPEAAAPEEAEPPKKRKKAKQPKEAKKPAQPKEKKKPAAVKKPKRTKMPPAFPLRKLRDKLRVLLARYRRRK